MTNDIIFGEDGWRKEYLKPENRKIIWIYIKLSNGNVLFLPKYNTWLSFEKYLRLNKVYISEIGIRHKTNVVKHDCTNADSIYVVRSIRGQFNGNTRDCYTIGLIKDKKVKKTMWLTPELVEEDAYEDDLENCFDEAIIENCHGKT